MYLNKEPHEGLEKSGDIYKVIMWLAFHSGFV